MTPGDAACTGTPRLLATQASASAEERTDEAHDLQRREGDDAALAGDALVARAHALAKQPLSPEQIIVVASARGAQAGSGDTFAAGAASARAYLYRDADHRVVCAGDVAAASSSGPLPQPHHRGADQPACGFAVTPHGDAVQRAHA